MNISTDLIGVHARVWTLAEASKNSFTYASTNRVKRFIQINYITNIILLHCIIDMKVLYTHTDTLYKPESVIHNITYVLSLYRD